VRIQTTAYGDKTFTGKIQSVSQVFDQEEKVLKARIVMDNTDLKLKPGMFVNVVVEKQTEEQAAKVPEKALIFSHDKYFLVAYQDDCQLQVKEVEVLAKNNGSVFLKEGIEPGENIIAQNHLLIYEALENIKK
jgi:cobalt-zinc-cadmium efflux system membrane fusion protein